MQYVTALLTASPIRATGPPAPPASRLKEVSAIAECVLNRVDHIVRSIFSGVLLGKADAGILPGPNASTTPCRYSVDGACGGTPMGIPVPIRQTCWPSYEEGGKGIQRKKLPFDSTNSVSVGIIGGGDLNTTSARTASFKSSLVGSSPSGSANRIPAHCRTYDGYSLSDSHI